MIWLDEHNSPSGDLCGSADNRAHCDWLLASSPRTGSTWLGRLLGEPGDVGQPKEWLNGMQVRDLTVRFGRTALSRWGASRLGARTAPLLLRLPWTDAALDAYLRRVRAVRTSPTGWFALKLHAHHRRRWFDAADRRFEDWFSPRLVVALHRRDTLAQAVSWARAIQSGAWASHQPGHAAPRYNARQIALCLRDIERDQADWRAWLDARPAVPRLFVAYEDLVADAPAVVARVREGLGVPPRDGPVPDVGLVRQADEVSLAWAQRFEAEHAGLGVGAGR